LAAYTNLVRATESVNELLSCQLSTFGLNMRQFQVPEVLLHLGPVNPATLCERILCSENSMTVVIDKLEAHGLIGRRAHQRDRWKKIVHLAPERQSLMMDVFPAHARLVRAQMSWLSIREQKALRRLCRKLAHGDAANFSVEMVKAEQDGIDADEAEN
jgi:MarR family 2-MHQ and catechol resistance regulon transcriptional repressor